MKKNIFNLIAKLTIISVVSFMVPLINVQAAAPTIVSTSPANGATNVSLNTFAINVTFNVAMDQNTLTWQNYTIVDNLGVTLDTMGVNYNATTKTASYSVTSGLSNNRTYTATLSTAIKDSLGNALAAPYVWTFSAPVVVDPIAPSVISTTPANGATNVPTGMFTISATLDKDAISSSVTNLANFTLVDDLGKSYAPFSYGYANKIATFSFIDSINANRTFTATISGWQNLAGVAMATPYVWTFSAITIVDPIAPSVISTTPASGATNVPAGTYALITVTFDKDIIIPTGQIILTDDQSATHTPMSTTYTNRTVTYYFTNQINYNRIYTATISGVTSLAGVAMPSPYVWTFSAPTLVDAVPPTVISVTPANGIINVATSTYNLSITFDKDILSSSLSYSSFSLTEGTSTPVNTMGYSYNNVSKTLMISLMGNLNPDKTYTASVSGLQNLAGTVMPAPYVWTFSTGIPTTIIPITLNAGWNLITLPGQPVTSTGTPINYTAESFGQLAGADMVTSWLSIGQLYNSHIVGFPLNDFNLTNGMGFFVHRATSTTLNLTTIPFPTNTPTVSAGWNLLGWTNNATTTANNYGLSITGADLITKWDNTTQLWTSHIINFPLNDFTVKQGDGIFVHKP